MNNDSFTTAGLATAFTVVAGIIYKAINHKRIRSECCGKKIVASIDIEETTPPQPHGFLKQQQEQQQEQSMTKEQFEQLQDALKQLQKLQPKVPPLKLPALKLPPNNTIENPMRPYLNTRDVETV